MDTIEVAPAATDAAVTLAALTQAATDRAGVQLATDSATAAQARADGDIGTGNTLLVALDEAIVLEAQGEVEAALAKLATDPGAGYAAAPGALLPSDVPTTHTAHDPQAADPHMLDVVG